MPWPASSMRMKPPSVRWTVPSKYGTRYAGRHISPRWRFRQNHCATLCAVHGSQWTPTSTARSTPMQDGQCIRGYATTTDRLQCPQGLVKSVSAKYSAHIKLSEEAQQRYGFSAVQINVGKDDTRGVEALSVLPTGVEVAEVLQRSCQRSEGLGIPLCLAACTELARCFPDLQFLHVLAGLSHHKSLAQQGLMNAPFGLKSVAVSIFTRANKSAVTVDLVPARSFDINITNGPTRDGKQTFTIRLEYLRDELVHTDAQTHKRGQPLDEYLQSSSKAIHMVIEQLSREMIFMSAQSAAQYISEALLRTLRNHLPGARLKSVSVTIDARGNFVPAITASTALADSLVSSAPQSHPINATAPTADPHLQWSKLLQRLESASEKTLVLSGKTNQRGIWINTRKQLKLHSRLSSRYPAVARAIGCGKLGYTICWSAEDAPSALHLTCDAVDSIIEQHAPLGPINILAYLPMLTATLAANLPGGATIRVSASAPLTAFPVSDTVRLVDDVHITWSREQDGGKATSGEYAISLPSLDIANLLKAGPGISTTVNLYLRMTAQMLTRADPSTDFDFIQHLHQAFQVVQEAIKPRLASTSRSDLEDDVARDILNIIVQADAFFPGLLKTTSVFISASDHAKSYGRAQWPVLSADSETKVHFSASDQKCVPRDDNNQLSDDVRESSIGSSEQEGAISTAEDVDGLRTFTRGKDRGGSEPHVLSGTVQAGKKSSVCIPPLGPGKAIGAVSFHLHWPTKELAIAEHMTSDKMASLLSAILAHKASLSLRSLVEITSAFRNALPNRPSTTLRFLLIVEPSDRKQHKSKIRSRVIVTMDELNSLPSNKLRLCFTLANVDWGTGPTSRRCRVYLSAHYALTTGTQALPDIEASEITSAVLEVLAKVARPLLATHDTDDHPKNLASHILDLAQEDVMSILPHGPMITVMDSALRFWPPSSGSAIGTSFREFKHGTTPKTEPSRTTLTRTAPSKSASVIIALGSNLGNRLGAIEDACSVIDSDPDMQIARTSNLYESAPMYVTDQDRFLNGVCEIRTQLSPLDLLDRLQAIETGLGRIKTVDKGPRNIDLDILLYENKIVQTERLTIPHKLIKEREFVLRPLHNLRLGRIPPLHNSAQSFLEKLGVMAKPSMYAQLSLGPPRLIITAGDPKRRTQIMSVLNVTPDSFSDGGDNKPTDIEALKMTVTNHIAAGATIIDIGGQSSRPNAPDVTAEDEIARILPAIEAMRSLPEAEHVAISIDTYRASVAEAAIKAGAHIINDISGGLLDSEMMPTVARLGCTYIMMHMRGTPATMQNEENLHYPHGLRRTIISELKARLDAAEAAGIRRWRIILDPGIGFSKTVEQNLEILRDLPAFRQVDELADMPWLVGSSRKGFVGKITDVAEAKDRTWGTAATVTAAVQGGAEIVRVHDVAEMAQVVKMSDALYRI